MADSPGSMKPDHSIRNTLVVGVVGGTLAGFIAAMMLGTFRVGEGDDVTEWISAVAALIAVIISALAVVLVGETLKATRDTLNETRKMSESQVQMAQDQKYIGITQTRPWVCISDYRIRCDEHLEDNTYVFITVKNFGHHRHAPFQWGLKYAIILKAKMLMAMPPCVCHCIVQLGEICCRQIKITNSSLSWIIAIYFVGISAQLLRSGSIVITMDQL